MQKSQSKILVNFSSISRSVGRRRDRRQTAEGELEVIDAHSASGSSTFSSTFNTGSIIGVERKSSSAFPSTRASCEGESETLRTRDSNSSFRAAPTSGFAENSARRAVRSRTQSQESQSANNPELKDFRRKRPEDILSPNGSQTGSSKVDLRMGRKESELYGSSTTHSQTRRAQVVSRTAPSSKSRSNSRAKGSSIKHDMEAQIPHKTSTKSQGHDPPTSILKLPLVGSVGSGEVVKPLVVGKSAPSYHPNRPLNPSLTTQAASSRKLQQRKGSAPLRSAALNPRQYKSAGFDSDNSATPFQALHPRPRTRSKRSEQAENSPSVDNEPILSVPKARASRTFNDLSPARDARSFNQAAGQEQPDANGGLSVVGREKAILFPGGQRSAYRRGVLSLSNGGLPLSIIEPLRFDTEQDSTEEIGNDTDDDEDDGRPARLMRRASEFRMTRESLGKAFDFGSRLADSQASSISSGEKVLGVALESLDEACFEAYQGNRVEKYVVPTFLGEIAEELRRREYRVPGFLKGSDDSASIWRLVEIFSTGPNYGRDTDLSEEPAEVLCEAFILFITDLPGQMLDSTMWQFLWNFCVNLDLHDFELPKRFSVAKNVFEMMSARQSSLISFVIDFAIQIISVPDNFLLPGFVSDMIGGNLFCSKRRFDGASDPFAPGLVEITKDQASKAFSWLMEYWKGVTATQSLKISKPNQLQPDSSSQEERSRLSVSELLQETSVFQEGLKLGLRIDPGVNPSTGSSSPYNLTSFSQIITSTLIPTSPTSDRLPPSVGPKNGTKLIKYVSIANELGNQQDSDPSPAGKTSPGLHRTLTALTEKNNSNKRHTRESLGVDERRSAHSEVGAVRALNRSQFNANNSRKEFTKAAEEGIRSNSLENKHLSDSEESDYWNSREPRAVRSVSRASQKRTQNGSLDSKVSSKVKNRTNIFRPELKVQAHISQRGGVLIKSRVPEPIRRTQSELDIKRTDENLLTPTSQAINMNLSSAGRSTSNTYELMNERTLAALEKARLLQLRSALRAKRNKVNGSVPIFEGQQQMQEALVQVFNCQTELLKLSGILKGLESHFARSYESGSNNQSSKKI